MYGTANITKEYSKPKTPLNFFEDTNPSPKVLNPNPKTKEPKTQKSSIAFLIPHPQKKMNKNLTQRAPFLSFYMPFA